MIKLAFQLPSVSFLFCLFFFSFPVFSLRHKGGRFPSPPAFLQLPASYLSSGAPPLQQQQQQQAAAAAAAAAALNVSEMLPRVVSRSLRAVGPRGLRGPTLGSPFLGARNASSTAAAAAAATTTTTAAAAAATTAGGPRRRPFTRTKQVATIGPASWEKEQIEALYLSGVDVFRLNFSHGLYSEKHQQFKYIREIEEEHGASIGVLADLPGPKLRVGCFKPDEVTLQQGQEFVLDGIARLPGNSRRVSLQQPEILKALQVGHSVLIDDGKIKLRVIELSPLLQQQQQQQQQQQLEQQEETEELWVRCVVEEGGAISSKKGVSVPRVSLPISALTERDRDIALMVSSWGVDFIGVSFVQQAADIVSLRSYLLSSLSSPVPLLVAKIEKQQAVDQIASIAAAADALMVARGDLGLDVRPEEIPRAQKEIIEAAKRARKPVIVATQMLESMMVNPMPLRAETADVAAAVFDGADAVMLSGETAAAARGPSIAQMQFNILQQTERDPRLWSLNLLRSKDAGAVFAAAAAASPFVGFSHLQEETLAAQANKMQGGLSPSAAAGLSPAAAAGGVSPSAARLSPSSSTEVSPSASGVSPFSSPSLVVEAMARGAHLLSRAVKAKAILVWSDRGEEASLLSLERPEAPIIAVSHDKHVARKLQLYWGVHPVHLRPSSAAAAAAAASEETDTPQQQAEETPKAGRPQRDWLETAKREAALCGIVDDPKELLVVAEPQDEASQGGLAPSLKLCLVGDTPLQQDSRMETAASAVSNNPSGCSPSA